MEYFAIFDAETYPSKPIGFVYCHNISKDFYRRTNQDYKGNIFRWHNREVTWLSIDQFKKEEYMSRASSQLLKFLTKKGLL